MDYKMISRLTLYGIWIFSIFMYFVEYTDKYITIMFVASVGIILNERIK